MNPPKQIGFQHHKTQQEIAAIAEQIQTQFQTHIQTNIQTQFQASAQQAEFHEGLQHCFVILCANNALAEHTSHLLNEIFKDDGNLNNVCIALIPGYVQAGVFRFESARRSIARRIDALFKMRQHKEIVIVTSVTGWFRTCPSLSWLRKNTIEVQLHNSLDQDSLVEKLQLFGYSQVNRIEEVGEYCVRGAILDVWPPTEKFPVRLEFFGDSIESIRLFKPSDQRSTSHKEKIELVPAREFVWHTEAEQEECIGKLNLFSLAKGLTGKVRADVLENVSQHVPFPGIDDVFPSYVPAAEVSTWQENLSQLLSLAKGSAHYFRLGSDDVFTDEFAEVERLYNVTSKAGKIETGESQKTYLTANFSAIFPEFKGLDHFLIGCFEPAPKYPLPDGLAQKFATAELQKISSRAQLMASIISQIEGPEVILTGESQNSLFELAPILQKYLPNVTLNFEALEASAEVNRFLPAFFTADKLTGTSLHSRFFIAIAKFDDYFYLPHSNTLAISESWLRGVSRESQVQANEVLEQHEWKDSNSSAKASRQAAEMLMQANFGDFQEGDLVVHVQYGVARFKGLMTVKVMDTSGDFLVLEYAGADKIYVPVHKFNLVQKYVGAGRNDDSALDSLKGGNWEKKKTRAREEAEKVAKELMEHQAKRATTPGYSFAKISEDYLAFCAAFPYDETTDQLRATSEIMADMSKPKPMDRLLVGDVGFGKTEVAFRAAYRCVLDGKQVAWLAPTTVLAHQHFRSAKERFADAPVSIAMLDRSSGTKAQNEVLQRLKKGDIDILIGTHRILSEDILFRDLGLLVVDEEQRFGVIQKERIKTMSYGVDALTMTATPIPRTLQMAMLGMRELSLLTTAPKSRLAVNTFVCPFDENIVKDAIVQELSRGGQVFFVHNRVEDLSTIEVFLKGLVPNARICVGHGKMGQKELDSTIIKFLEQHYDILLCTTIIESGIDMPNVNTILIQNAENFGLAQLYQLRGRVGRRSSRGYAYFLTSSNLALESDGAKRLEVLREHQELGSGFVIASHDLDMRGAGNILGDEQTGRSSEVGLETYSQLLDDAIRQLGGLKIVVQKEVELQVPVPFGIPENYIENPRERLKMYRRFFGTKTEEALESLVNECADRFGAIPEPVKNLSEIARLRRWLVTINAISLNVGDDYTELRLAGEVLNGANDEQS